MARIRLPEKSWTEIKREMRGKVERAKHARGSTHVGPKRLERLLDESDEREKILAEIKEIGKFGDMSNLLTHEGEGWVRLSAVVRIFEKYACQGEG